MLEQGLEWQIPEEKKVDVNSTFNNKLVVLTGILQSISRGDAKIKLAELGAKITSSISAKTDYLIAGEKAGSKKSKAEQLGVTILTEAKWLKMMEKD